MSFAGKVWRLLVGIKDALALLFLLLFFTVLFAALSARPNPAQVREGALLLDINGVVVEEVAPIDPFAALVSQQVPIREYAARDLVRAIDAAAGDERIKGLAIDLTGFLGGGQVHMTEISAALARFKTSEKPIYAYSMAYTDDALLIAAQADEIWVDPMGGALVRGPGGERLYFGAALERFGITANVFRAGTFKSATEPFTSTAMSEEARENIAQIYASLWQEYQAKLVQARPSADIELATSDIPAWLEASGGDLAKASKAAGLVDTIGTREEWGEHIAKTVGEDVWNKRPGAFAKTALDPWLADLGTEDGAGFGSGDKTIGVITIAGNIIDSDAGPGTAGAERIARLLDEALDDDLAALVVRVNSLGGTTTGSETIRRAIMRHKDKGIPIIVSMGNYATSGGYWVATPGQRIFAEPETITGSIGVFLVIPSFEGLLADYDVNTDGIRTTALSGQPDLFAGFNPEIEALLQSQVDANYREFLKLVAESRGITPERADELGQGRVWDGGAARQLGLVDQFGDLDAAIEYAAGAANLAEGDWQVRHLGAGEDRYSGLLAQLLGQQAGGGKPSTDVAARFARDEKTRLLRALSDFDALLGAEGVQARCLYCAGGLAPDAAPQSAAPTSSPSLLGWLVRLAAN